MWLSFVQAWVYQHFPSMGSKDAWAGYWENQYPRVMLFIPLSDLGTPDNYRNHLDALDLTRVVMTPYGDHREIRPFDRLVHLLILIWRRSQTAFSVHLIMR